MSKETDLLLSNAIESFKSAIGSEDPYTRFDAVNTVYQSLAGFVLPTLRQERAHANYMKYNVKKES